MSKIDLYVCDICKKQAPNNQITYEPIGINDIDGLHHICDKCLEKMKVYILKPKKGEKIE